MIAEPPSAFIGYGHDEKTGEFFIKVCPDCPDYKRAVLEALPLRAVAQLCPHHYQKQLAKRYP